MRLIKAKDGRYVFFCTFAEKRNAAGFRWDRDNRFWVTENPRIALRVAAYADDALREELISIAGDAPDPDRACLGLSGQVWRWTSPMVWNYPAKQAGFRLTKEPYPHWWTDDIAIALRCYEKALELKDGFVCAKEAQDVLREEQARRIGAVAASRAADAHISLPVPPGCELLPYQRAGVVYAKDKSRVLIGDQMRLGKTPQSIVWVNCDPSLRRGLIIVPATIKLNWERELKKWLTNGQSVGVAWGFDYWPKTDIVVVNSEILYRPKDKYIEAVTLKSGKPKMRKGKPVTRKVYPLRPEIRETAWDFVIVDEGHRFKDDTTARYQCLSSLQPRKRAVLTGTPIPNRPIEIFPILHWLDPKLFPDKWKFAMRYAGAKQGPFGWDLSGASNLEELQRILREKIMVRRLRSEVLLELPPKRRQLIEFPCPEDRFINEQQRLWKRYTDLSATIREAVDESLTTTKVEEYRERVQELETDRLACFEEMSRVRHEDALKRVPFVITHLKELLEEEPKVVCFAWHNDVVEQITEAFPNAECISIYGKTSQTLRVALQDRFNQDPGTKLCVISIAVCEGLDLSSASVGVMAEHDWVPKNIQQAEDRMENPFKKDSSLVQYLVFQGSLDARMAQTLVYKEVIGYDALDRRTIELAELQTVNAPEDIPLELPEKLPASGPASLEEADKFPVFRSSSLPLEQNQDANLSEDDCREIHEALRQLAGVCDGAFARDSVGFNAMDVKFGHTLAIADRLTPNAARTALGMLKKYQRQLDGRLERFYE
jgi:SWI/SNF-related matrix-associated actin-dependent regulator of chromatin subfamily A-like protein 1